MRRWIIASSCLIFGGCATTFTMKAQLEPDGVYPYQGTHFNLRSLSKGSWLGEQGSGTVVLLSLLDLPLSLAADTIILPYTIYCVVTKDNLDKTTLGDKDAQTREPIPTVPDQKIELDSCLRWPKELREDNIE